MARKMGITQTGEVPSRHFPRQIMLVSLITLLVVGGVVGGLSQTFWKSPVPSSGGIVPPAATETPTPTETPAPTLTPTATHAPLMIPAVEVLWVYIGQARKGNEVLALPIPWEKFSIEVVGSRPAPHVQGQIYWEDLGLREPAVGKGDGLAFLVASSFAGPGQPLLTSDRGKSWYRITNEPPIQLVYPGQPLATAAFIDGRVIVIFLVTGVETADTDPFLMRYWRAEIPLATLEGLSP